MTYSFLTRTRDLIADGHFAISYVLLLSTSPRLRGRKNTLLDRLFIDNLRAVTSHEHRNLILLYVSGALHSPCQRQRWKMLKELKASMSVVDLIQTNIFT